VKTRLRDDAVQQWAAQRVLWLDNLKVGLIGLIIAIHAVLSYVGSDEWWTYADVQETTLAPATEVVFAVVFGPFGLFLIALLFLVAGLMSEPSMRRKGPRRFARDRALRLGVPFLVVVGLVWPVLTYALYHPLGAAPGSFWAELTVDTGTLWFVGVLLIFSLGYAAVVALRGLPERPWPAGGIATRHLLLLVAAVGALTFVVRLVLPLGAEDPTDLNLWEWPACLGLFAVGVLAAPHGWAREVPSEVRRHARVLALIGLAAAAGLYAAVAALDVDPATLLGGPTVAAAAFVTVEATLTVFGSMWLLGLAQAHLDRPLLPHGAALARAAYGAFLVQGPVLIGLALLLRPLDVPAEVKALTLVATGVAASFGVAHLVVTRVPVLSRVL
jgi:peptidoglycan/LPS O-acetylase OafA/YrhL